jgi:hypothetical protein
MNTDALAKLYDRLTPRERLSLIMAANARGDETEENRLARSAPRTTFSVPDFYGLAEGVQNITLFIMIDLLDTAVRFWLAGGKWSESVAFKGKRSDASQRELNVSAGLAGYLIKEKLAGWRQFCAEFKADPELLMSFLPGYETVKHTEEAVEMIAFTREETAAWLRNTGDETDEVITAEAVATGLWVVVNRWADSWK